MSNSSTTGLLCRARTVSHARSARVFVRSWTAPTLKALYPTASMMNQHCYSLGAVACAVVELIQLRATSEEPLPIPTYGFLDTVLNSTETFVDDATLVLLGSGPGHNDTFTALDGNHRLLILLTRALLWESPVCNTEAARAVSRQRYGVVCHHVSMETTRVKTLTIMSPRVRDPAFQEMFSIDVSFHCPPHRAQGIRCIILRAGMMMQDEDPVYGNDAVARKLAKISSIRGQSFDELAAEAKANLEAKKREDHGSGNPQ